MGIGISDSNACFAKLDDDLSAPVPPLSPKVEAALDDLLNRATTKDFKELAHQLQLDRVATAVDKFISHPSLADYKDLRDQLDVWTPSTDDPNQAI
jgi:hypothetical protein